MLLMKVLAFPFRFDPSAPGKFVTVEQDGDEYRAQQIAAFVQTTRGERPIYQDFGTDDPTFRDFDDSAFAADFATFYPDVPINSIEITRERGAIVDIVVEFA